MTFPQGTSPRAPSPMKRTYSRARAAFSLLELFIVLSIMVIVMGIALNLFRDNGARPLQAMELVSGMASVARESAIATGSPARVVICVDPKAGVKYLRYVVVLADVDGNPATVKWMIANKAETLPLGTIFWPEFSTPAVPANTMKLDLSTGVQDDTSGATCVFIEFDALGNPARTGQQWVFTKAIMDDAGGAPFVPKPMDRDGFIVRQTGALAYFRSPEEIRKP